MVVRSRALLALTALLLAAGPAPPQTTVHTLDPGSWIFGTWCVDLNGDGLKDILIQIAPDGPRKLCLFVQGKKGFSATPDQVLPVPGQAAYFVAGRVGPDMAAGVLFLGHGFTAFHAWKGKGLTTEGVALFAPDIFPRLPHPSFCYAWRVHGDLDHDGRPDLLLPVQGGYRVFSRKDGKAYQAGPVLPLPVRRRGDRVPGAMLTLAASLPMPSLTDLDGDGRTDLMVMIGPRMKAFFQGPGGLDEKPGVNAPLPFLRDIPQGLVVLDRMALADIDGNGVTDLLYMRKLGRIGLFGSLRTRISLFLGPFHDKKKPDQILNLSGLARRPRLFDFDRDGDLDLQLGSLKVDIFTTLRHVVGDEVPAVFRVHLFDRSRNQFQARARVEHAKRIPFRAMIEYRPVPLAFFHGDFNGDGHPDLLDAVDASHLLARPGAPTRKKGYEYAKSPLFKVEVAYSENLYLDDFTGEGCTDILTFAGSRATVILCR